MLETNDLAAIMLDTLCKSFLLFVLVLLLIFAMRRFSSKASNVHAEHRVWLFLILAMLALPVVAISAPNLQIPVALLPANEAPSPSGDQQNLQLEVSDDRTGSDHVADTSTTEIETPFNTTPAPNPSLLSNDQANSERPDFAATRTSVLIPEPLATQSKVDPLKTAFTSALVLWLAGTTILGLRFLFGLVAVRRILCRSSEVSLPRSLRRMTPGSTSVLQNKLVESPVVTGWLKHQVILPICWSSWSHEKLEAVLAHEFAHVKRRDGLASLVSELNLILNWVNPAAWIAKAQLSKLAELACDQAAVISTGSRKEYARHLLEIAALSQSGQPQPGIPMASGREIGHRIDRILDSAIPLARKVSRLFLIALLLIGTPSLLVVAAIQPTRQVAEDKDSFQLDMTDHQWYRTENGKSYLRFRLAVLNPDGSFAKDAKVKARSRDPFTVTAKENYFLLEYEIKMGYQPGLRALATSADGKLIGHIWNGSDQMTSDAKNGLTLKLAPSRTVTVNVTDNGQPVADAKVGADWVTGFELFATTDETGIANLQFPMGTKLDRLAARTRDGRIGGYMFSRKPVRDPLADHHEIQLHKCRSQVIRFVDQNNRPVPNIDFELNIADKENYNFIPLFEKGKLSTDENGEAVADWFPDWEHIHAYVDDLSDKSWSKVEDEKIEDGVLIVRLEQNEKLKRVKITGKVNMPEGLQHCFLVRLGSFEHPEESRSDIVDIRTDQAGNFTAEVMPGATYCAHVNDFEWISDYWTGILIEPDSNKTRAVELNISKGERVEIIATAGPDKTPMSNLTLSLRQSHHFHWLEDGEKQYGSMGPQWWATTDENGRAFTIARTGELEIRANESDWRPEKEINVNKGQKTMITFHRKSPGKRTVSGQVLSPEGQLVQLDGLEVKLYPMDGESRDETSAIASADGRFSAQISAATIGAIVKTPDAHFFGKLISDAPEDGLKIKLESTATFDGQLTDSNGKPLEGKWVRLKPYFENPKLKKNSPYAYSGEALEPLEATTDTKGKFSIVGVPYGMKLTLRRQSIGNPDSERGIRLGSRYLTRGENRPPEIIRTTSPGSPTPVASAKEILADKIADCRAIGIRLLVIIENDEEPVREFVRSNFTDTEKTHDLLGYVILRVGAKNAKTVPARKALFESMNWTVPEKGKILVVAIDGDGSEIDRTEVDTNSGSATEVATTFVSKNIGPKKDALKKYNDALSEAKRTGKKVWIRLSQTRCAPCFHFSRWVEQNRSELEQGFVFVKIDDLLDANATEVIKKLLGDKHFGIPYCQILDADGNLVIDSEGPLGNIGHPSSFEGINHLKKMLKSHRGFNADQVDSLAQDVRNH